MCGGVVHPEARSSAWRAVKHRRDILGWLLCGWMVAATAMASEVAEATPTWRGRTPVEVFDDNVRRGAEVAPGARPPGSATTTATASASPPPASRPARRPRATRPAPATATTMTPTPTPTPPTSASSAEGARPGSRGGKARGAGAASRRARAEGRGGRCWRCWWSWWERGGSPAAAIARPWARRRPRGSRPVDHPAPCPNRADVPWSERRSRCARGRTSSEAVMGPWPPTRSPGGDAGRGCGGRARHQDDPRLRRDRSHLRGVRER